MTRTGTTNRQGRSYSYYSCAGCQQKGKTVWKCRHITVGTLDEIVLTNLKQRMLAAERIMPWFSVAEVLRFVLFVRHSHPAAIRAL